MPKGPKGQKRPADAVGAAITVARIATGEIDHATIVGTAGGGTSEACQVFPTSRDRRNTVGDRASREIDGEGACG